MFGTARATYATNGASWRKGEPKKESLDYAFRLAVERISGEPLDEGFETWSMTRGHDLEPDARREHEIQSGVVVERVGFIMTDDRKFGASLDGTIGEDGASEYKAFVDPCKLRTMLFENDQSIVADQAQGVLWISGRKWLHLGLYCPALAPAGKALTVWEIQRDDDYIGELELDLVKFLRIVDQYEERLRLPLAA